MNGHGLAGLLVIPAAVVAAVVVGVGVVAGVLQAAGGEGQEAAGTGRNEQAATYLCQISRLVHAMSCLAWQGHVGFAQQHLVRHPGVQNRVICVWASDLGTQLALFGDCVSTETTAASLRLQLIACGAINEGCLLAAHMHVRIETVALIGWH